MRLDAEMALEREIGQPLSDFPGDLSPAKVKRAAQILGNQVREPAWYAERQAECRMRFGESKR